ncbi:MAG TPA: hypothetical protein VFC65_01225 [Prolixibacteraceae bacterium]|nr:hypothetical protein [Prolixibacteraceae bacterium]
MGTLKNIQETDGCMNEVIPQKVRVGRVLNLFLVLFMLSCMIGLSSCAVGVRTPRPHRTGIVIESHTRLRPERRERHYRHVHHSRKERHHDHD